LNSISFHGRKKRNSFNEVGAETINMERRETGKEELFMLLKFEG